MSDDVKTGLPRAHAARPTLPILLTGGFLVVLLAVAGLIVLENYRNALKEGEARALSSAHVVAAHLEWMIEASDQALRRIETEVDNRPIDGSPGLAADLSRAVGQLPAGFQYSLLDDAGIVRFSSAGESAAGNVSDNHGERAYFQRVRDGQELTFSRLLDNERVGKPSFTIARRIDRGGIFRGVASITIPNESLDGFWASLRVGPNSTILIIRDDGWLIARRPATTRPIDLSTTAWYPMTRQRSSGFYHSPASPIDGHARIVAFWKVSGWPLIALAAVARQEVLDQFWRNLSSDALIMLPLMALLVLGAFWINRLLYRTAARNEELEQAVERNRFLLREIHHRVKNNLQAVLALVRLQALPADARDDMTRRIAAMIAVHEQIYQNDQFEQVEVAPYATKLITDIASGYDIPVNLSLDLQPLTVDREQALPIGMIINEVVSNSFKYAFAGRDEGRLTVELRKQGENFSLLIRDDGPGIEVFNRAGGMGSRLIANFVRQLGGQFTTSNDGGAVFSMTAPLKQETPEAA
ncbi:sensor histidine kinase [Rhizobium terrae]|uniref:sensor histidine kinase n=1 Tax=Rhizobium terrae TaxID=2171756 RepID=UPI0013C352A9|nr:histidine kinase dimerization/phosphoacceptor domain -containing protein [Rhizobium terrae]